jgi:tetratricopeptide (TPR) repeat protein
MSAAESRRSTDVTNATKASTNQPWTSLQAYSLAVICLLIGIAGGWLIRGSGITSASAPLDSASLPESGTTSQAPTPVQLQQMAGAQVGPLLEKLKADPNNSDLLANIGNVYYDGQLYAKAIEYYGPALKVHPSNSGVRTDMATAYWYLGDADNAIEEFQNSLSYEPNKPNTLFNLGIVQWQGKMDIKGAVATWQKLLDTNPNYEGKEKVLELMAQAQKHSGVKPGTPAKPLQN